MNRNTILTATSDANRSGYDRWSQTYDTAVNSTVACDDMHFPALWADARHQDVLEIGCGTGRHTVRLAAQGNRVTAIDLSPGMLAVARVKLAGFDVRLVEHDIVAGPVDGVFDIAVAALVLEHIADMDLFFARVAAALWPGGRFFMSEVEPERLAAGGVARFTDPDSGEVTRLRSFARPSADIVASAARAGLTMTGEQDVLGDSRLTAVNPAWVRHEGRPMIRMWSFVR